MRVLFIGNSYTSVNDLPAVLGGFVRTLAPGTRWETGSLLVNGATLESHWKRDATRALIRDGGWTHVVLQEQSLLGNLRTDGVARMSPPEDRFLPHGRLLAREISQAGARPVFFMTWSRKVDLPAQQVLTWAYTDLAREQKGVLSPVGVAWQRVRQAKPGLELYAEDGHHPGPAGTYLAACVLYTSLFQKPCVGAPASVGGTLPEATARYLQQVGSEVGLAAQLPETAVAPPAPLVLPSLPRGMAWDAGRGTGTWEGMLAFFPAELGMAPVPLRLALDLRGARPSGRVRILLPQEEPFEVDVAPRVEEGVLSFSVERAPFLDAPMTFRAVLTEDGLRGVSTAEDSYGGRWFGSWSLRSVQD